MNPKSDMLLAIFASISMVGMLITLFFMVSGCDSARQASGAYSSERIYDNEIVCWNPQSGEEIYRDTVDDWRLSAGHEQRLNANSTRGTIRITGNFVRYIDDDGLEVYLVNYPCRIREIP